MLVQQVAGQRFDDGDHEHAAYMWVRKQDDDEQPVAIEIQVCILLIMVPRLHSIRVRFEGCENCSGLGR
jgi:hypothetical protein